MLVLPNKVASVWQKFLDDNRVLVYKYIVREIKRGLEQEKNSIDLFRFEDGSMTSTIVSAQYIHTLEYALSLFIKAEEFEYAGRTEAVMRMYYAQVLINETKNKRT